MELCQLCGTHFAQAQLPLMPSPHRTTQSAGPACLPPAQHQVPMAARKGKLRPPTAPSPTYAGEEPARIHQDKAQTAPISPPGVNDYAPILVRAAQAPQQGEEGVERALPRRLNPKAAAAAAGLSSLHAGH